MKNVVTPAQDKLSKRMGRRASSLRPECTGYGRRAAGHMPHPPRLDAFHVYPTVTYSEAFLSASLSAETSSQANFCPYA
jgi:hypothetical protein